MDVQMQSPRSSPLPSLTPTIPQPTSSPKPIAIPVLITGDNNANTSATTNDNTTTEGKKPVSSAKPKSTKTPRPRSPSPTPPPPVPPLQTIRLTIALGGPSNYAVDIASLAKATGQRPPTPVLQRKDDISESEGEEEEEEKGGKKRKKHLNEYYDVNDPFIDDSELALDERTFFAQTKQQGFYVSSGEVALARDKTPKKPKSTKKAQAVVAAHVENGTRDAPIALDSDLEQKPGEEKAGQKRKRYVTVTENGKKRKIVDVNSFHPELQKSISALKEAIGKESWSQKGKFPPSIKPMLGQLALQAIKLDEYDEHFFNLMPVLFPYNKFTMTKLIKRTVFPDHVTLLQERMEGLLKDLEKHAKEGFVRAEEEWERSVVAWDKRQEKLKETLSAMSANGNAPAEGSHPPAHSASGDESRAPTEERGDGMDVDAPEGSTSTKTPTAAESHPPTKKFRMTEQMKGIVWELVLLSNECCRLENEKNVLEGSVLQVSEQGLRKVLYQKIVAAFPEGWMSSGQISRDVSAMKKKFEREVLEGGEGVGPGITNA